MSQADITLSQGNDSVALAQYQQVANEYGYEAGNRAALVAATMLYRDGKYEEAINNLKNFDPKEALVGAAAMSLEGDCYVNLQKYSDALASYDKAIKISDNNALYTPLFMLKKATVLREQKDYAAELKVLQGHQGLIIPNIHALTILTLTSTSHAPNIRPRKNKSDLILEIYRMVPSPKMGRHYLYLLRAGLTINANCWRLLCKVGRYVADFH